MKLFVFCGSTFHQSVWFRFRYASCFTQFPQIYFQTKDLWKNATM